MTCLPLIFQKFLPAFCIAAVLTKRMLIFLFLAYFPLTQVTQSIFFLEKKNSSQTVNISLSCLNPFEANSLEALGTSIMLVLIHNS